MLDYHPSFNCGGWDGGMVVEEEEVGSTWSLIFVIANRSSSSSAFAGGCNQLTFDSTEQIVYSENNNNCFN